MIIDTGKAFFKTEEFKSGDTVKIVGEAEKVESKFDYSPEAIAKNPDLAGKKKPQVQVEVEFNGVTKFISLNNTSVKNIREACGKESKDWIGAELVAEKMKMPNQKYMIEWKVVEWKE